jgi:N utilization substance protein B
MLNRRYIRVKVFQALYSFYQSDKKDLIKIEKEMVNSIEKIYDLYLYLILLLVEMKSISEKALEQGKGKRMPTEADLNPNMKFVNNLVIKQFEDNVIFKKLCTNRKIGWHPDEDLPAKLFKKIKESDDYIAYMESPGNKLGEDKDFITKIISKFINDDEGLEFHLEEKSIYWIDDLSMVNVNIIKTIKDLKGDSTENSDVLVPLYKDREDDIDFIQKLYRETISENIELEKHIKETIKNWELDRIALLDMILMKMALTEMINFSSIPVKVSMNEYIELSKYYSTPKSKIFINGVLDKLSARLRGTGVIEKKGRGLVE